MKLRACLPAVALTVLLAACGSAPVVSTPAPAQGFSAPASTTGFGTAVPPITPAVIVLPASIHVTGTYPKTCHAINLGGGALGPDPRCTPGAATAAVTQANIKTTICNPSWRTGSIRAPQSETGRVKKLAMIAYGLPASSIGTTELDHLDSLALGGSNDVRNLWPEPSDIPGAGFRNRKDDVESKLHAAVCRALRPVLLADARAALAANWTTALTRFGLK
jgi:hypothetical protein